MPSVKLKRFRKHCFRNNTYHKYRMYKTIQLNNERKFHVKIDWKNGFKQTTDGNSNFVCTIYNRK